MPLGKDETFAEFLIYYRLSYGYRDFNPNYFGHASSRDGSLNQKLSEDDVIPIWTDKIYLSIEKPF